MRKSVGLFLSLTISLSAFAQKQKSAQTMAPRPKLVVGIMVDQMRWDYLYRFFDRYGNSGFRRLMKDGMNCENTMIPYAQTVTAAGHACVYTGSVPAINGIMGNDWFDKNLNRQVYCTEDKSVKLVGIDKGEPMSPANLWTTTICDELRLSSNFRSKVISIAIKDRASILPAGHSANAAYWYDGISGHWITSTYYMNELPSWVNRFNNEKWPDRFYQKDWNTLYPIKTYTQSAADSLEFEGRFFHETGPVFPHELKSKIRKDYGIISSTPFGNTFTLQFAREALMSEGLGKHSITDFLAISLSSPDYIGHQFGPNSIEVEDCYLRLDKDLGDFLTFLDKELGKEQYTVFLTADHAVAQVPGFLQQNKIPAKSIESKTVSLNKAIEDKFAITNTIRASANYQLYLNDSVIDNAKPGRERIKKFIIDYLNKDDDVFLAFDCREINNINMPQSLKEKFVNGFNAKRAGDIQVVLKPGIFYGGKAGTSHGSIYPYDSHIPLLWMGWGIKPGNLNREVYMTDIAPTIANLLHIQMPSGSVGKVIAELLK